MGKGNLNVKFAKSYFPVPPDSASIPNCILEKQKHTSGVKDASS